ncbi:abortive infection protein [Bifidobacterium lemurum]|uniref:Abortive infection protein n=1 Tax=Bifidobacterium lemurum TaxID=1603886 RepID=A0A261FNI6_9BIFI|nr:nucleotidyl transferase AbiEii/AbiGii toxin family protein [Bifidobacterium lemurum]OZG60533.1 abortive infection protein [Bifidobacterium lemurum]QOL34451.1 nucleotidyl transferase AbiEii/AbiGii toxin family protein [Bifidobacterium lemurum]
MSTGKIRALIKEKSHHDPNRAQSLYCLFAMERFLSRLSLSDSRDLFVIKGGLLVQATLGIDSRTTLDIDSTMRRFELSEPNIRLFLKQVISTPLNDGITFEVKEISEIRDEAEYPGYRAKLRAAFENMSIPFKIDFSTGEALTPNAVRLNYPLTFDKGTIPLASYNLETLLAEKLETVLSRGTANTRMRDFYDIAALIKGETPLDAQLLKAAFFATNHNRGNQASLENSSHILSKIRSDEHMAALWSAYQRKYDYAMPYSFDSVIDATLSLCKAITANPRID